LVNIVRWRVLKENSKKQFEFMHWWMDWQRSHPEKFYYTRSRLFTFAEEGSSEENWMFLDEYEQREDFHKQLKAAREDPELSKVLNDECFPGWDPLIVLGSKRRGEVWTEVEKLRVELVADAEKETIGTMKRNEQRNLKKR
jgi:hypothetical protein